MLVLSRKKEQSVILRGGGAEIVVTVVEMRGDKVRLGFDAPSSVTIHRKEVQELVDAGIARGPALVPTKDTATNALIARHVVTPSDQT